MDFGKLEKKISGKRSGAYSSMYIYCTEMVGKYYPLINVKNKKVLTSTGSGDQIIDAYFFGAKKVVGFDLNRLCPYILNLKISAIKKLSYDEFIEYFGRAKGYASFNYKLYLKFYEELNKKTKTFFDNLYKYYNFNGLRIAKSDFIHRRDFTDIVSTGGIAYLKNKKNYDKVRSILHNKKIKIIMGDIKNIPLKSKEKFDIINISNIPNFIIGRKFKNKEGSVLKFYNSYILKFKKILNPRGKICFYIYSSKNYPNPLAKAIPSLNVPSKRNVLKKVKDFRYKEFSFRGVRFYVYKKFHREINEKDKILCLQKL